jgi:hypothetical protein
MCKNHLLSKCEDLRTIPSTAKKVCGRKCLKIIFLIKVQYPEYTKNAYNRMLITQEKQLPPQKKEKFN